MKKTFFLFRRLVCWWLAGVAGLAGAERAFVFDADVKVPMRDGVRLSADLWRPKADGHYPVILLRTPYGKPAADWDEAKRYTAAGYVVVAQDCRGRGQSEGRWEPFRHEAADGYDTQEWIGRQPWCNGAIGTTGGSYVGWTQWATAPNASKYLKAMMPMVPFDDAYDIAYVGGAFQLALLMGWGAGVGGVELGPEELAAAFRHLPLETYGDQFERKIPYLDAWVKHSHSDDYWRRRGIGHRYADVTVPLLNVGGWYDIFAKKTLDLVTAVRAHSRDPQARRNAFAIIGPWTHDFGGRQTGALDFGPGARFDTGDWQFRWFEHWLKDRETGVEEWPAYYLFIMGENRWRAENEWPLARTRYTSWFLHSAGRANTRAGDGTLDTEAPEREAVDEFTCDPNNPVPTAGGNNLEGSPAGPFDQAGVEERQDVLVYSTAPLERDIEVTGPVKMTLYAASSARDTDFTAKLVDVYPDGKAYNLCDGIMRARHRNGPADDAFLTPGRPERFEIDLWVTSNVFARGHRIRVEVSSGNFPRFDRNPNSGKTFGTDIELLTARQTILHDTEHPSHLVLPVIPR